MAESRPTTALIAEKSLRYSTRRLVAGDPFTASKRDARLLVAIGKARYATADAVAADEPDMAVGDIADLREAYTARFGKKPFGGWDVAKLREKLAEAED